MREQLLHSYPSSDGFAGHAHRQAVVNDHLNRLRVASAAHAQVTRSEPYPASATPPGVVPNHHFPYNPWTAPPIPLPRSSQTVSGGVPPIGQPHYFPPAVSGGVVRNTWQAPLPMPPLPPPPPGPQLYFGPSPHYQPKPNTPRVGVDGYGASISSAGEIRGLYGHRWHRF
ncbi:hypothetical protein TWF718_000431 [Orbilia javanica]|uniref:Uncharacterized protein n=1 Tax=Orbilia javanica TaxID=47235 RepID=A0AAN8N7E8_9PEZI